MPHQMTEDAHLPFISKKALQYVREMPDDDAAQEAMKVARSHSLPPLLGTVSIAVLAYWKRALHLASEQEMGEFLDRTVRDPLVSRNLYAALESCGRDLDALAGRWGEEALLAAAMNEFAWRERPEEKRQVRTSWPFCRLAMELLQVRPGDVVLDCFSGTADFAVDAFLQTEASEIHGIELSEDAAAIGKMRAMLLPDSIFIHHKNSVLSGICADRVFADPPFAVRDDSSINGWNPKWIKASGIYEALPRTRKMDWAFLLSALEKQHDGGRSAILSYDGMLFRDSHWEREMRRLLVESGSLEAVIALPQGISAPSNILYDLLVFSQENDNVNMVDARDCRSRQRFTNEMDMEHIEEVIHRTREETSRSRSVRHQEIAEQEFDLRPSRYVPTASANVDDDGVPLEELIVLLRRGLLGQASSLERLASQEKTGFQYLMLKDLEDDELPDRLPYLKGMEKGWERFCIPEGSLIISRSAPVKIALAQGLGNRTVLASGNIYFMLLDWRRVNPVYALCYLRSKEGMEQIESLSKGSSILTLSRKDLIRIRIPLPHMEKQNAIAREYIFIREQIAELKRKERDLEERLSSLLKS